MRNQHNDVGHELKAVAQDMLALGARAMQTGRDWLTDRRNDMNERNRGPQSRQGGEGQSRHSSNYYASKDYGRGQAYGQEGLHAEYGSYGGAYRDHEHVDDNRFGERGQSGGDPGRTRSQPEGQSQWGRGGAGGGGGHRSRGGGDYRGASYASQGHERQGMGYGSSSSYGNPGQHSYAGGEYGQASFVSPADTQFRGGDYSSGGGGYRGHGPRNYTRSDSRIQEDLCERLTEAPDIDPSDIEVRVSDGTVTLEGSVEERWMKHRAEDLADGCGGVRNVENRIRVQSRQGQGQGHDARNASGYSASQGGSARASGGTETGSPATPTSRSPGSEGGGSSAGGSSSTKGQGSSS